MTTGRLDPAPSRESVEVRLPWTAYQLGVGTLCLVVLCWRAWTTSRWTWYADDWLYMADTRSMSFVHYLFQDYNGHLMPAGFLVSWVVTKAAPLDFTLPVVLVAAAAATNTWLWGKALAAVAGERLVLLAPLAVLTLSPLMIRPTIWWASALQVLPLQIALALTVLAAHRLATSSTRADLVRLMLVLLLGLAFWEKALLLVVPAATVILHSCPRVVPRAARAAHTTWLALGSLAVSYTAGYLLLTRTATNDREMGVQLDAHRSLSAHVEFFLRGFGDLLSPALLGGPWHTLPGRG